MDYHRNEIQRALKVDKDGFMPRIQISGPERSKWLNLTSECVDVLIEELREYKKTLGNNNKIPYVR